MEIKNILKSCMELGLVKFKIKGRDAYPRTIIKNRSGSEFLIDGRYSCRVDDLQLISIDTERIKKITEVFNFLLEFSEEDGINLNDLSKISALLILKNLKEKENDVERAEYLRKHLDTEHTLLQDLVTDSEENDEEIDVPIPLEEDLFVEDTDEDTDEEGMSYGSRQPQMDFVRESQRYMGMGDDSLYLKDIMEKYIQGTQRELVDQHDIDSLEDLDVSDRPF